MPRAYLLPSQTQRSGHTEPTFKPAIDARSKVRCHGQPEFVVNLNACVVQCRAWPFTRYEATK